MQCYCLSQFHKYSTTPNENPFYVGTAHLVDEHPAIAKGTTVDTGEAFCYKDTGRSGKLRKWSRGHQFIVRGGGHIDSWQPLYK